MAVVAHDCQKLNSSAQRAHLKRVGNADDTQLAMKAKGSRRKSDRDCLPAFASPYPMRALNHDSGDLRRDDRDRRCQSAGPVAIQSSGRVWAS